MDDFDNFREGAQQNEPNNQSAKKCGLDADNTEHSEESEAGLAAKQDCAKETKTKPGLPAEEESTELGESPGRVA